MNVPGADRSLRLRSGFLHLDRVRVVGILNVTPDSFYDGGRYASPDRAVDRALEMVSEGADVIEIGGEKAGPAEPVPAEEELSRVVPVVDAVRRATPVPISVDTFKPEVARAAVESGADILNSIDGFENPLLRRVAVESGAAVVIMHIQGRPRVPNPDPRYRDVVTQVRKFLDRRAQECIQEGIPADSIVVDPGPGFGKTTDHDIQLLRRLDALTSLPFPLMLAASRKRFIGDVLGGGPEDRLEGSLAVVAWGVLKGARLVRVHDVRASKRVCTMIESVFRPELVAERAG